MKRKTIQQTVSDALYEQCYLGHIPKKQWDRMALWALMNSRTLMAMAYGATCLICRGEGKCVFAEHCHAGLQSVKEVQK